MLELGEEEVPGTEKPGCICHYERMCGRIAVKVAKYLKTNHIVINARDESDKIKP